MENNLLPTRSVWSATTEMPAYPPLYANITAEVCVIGAGIAGLTTAYLLAKQGVSVAVIEAINVGAGETSHTTAHIAVPDDRYWHIDESYGTATARLVADSFAAAADLIEATARSEHIDCDFERLDGFLFSCADDPRAALQKEYAAAIRAGVRVSWDERAPIDTLPAGPCLRFAQQAQFHPLRYLAGLAGAVTRLRGAIFCGARVQEVEEHDDGVVIRTAMGKITANAAVVATNTPFNDRVAIHIKQFAYQTYVVAAPVKRGSLPRVLIWDDGDPYHYIRLARGPDDEHDLLIVGGADHKTGQEPHPQKCYDELEAWLRSHFPYAGPPAYRWSGQVMEPLDGIAYLGRNPGSRNVYVISGDSGNGISHSTIGAMLVCDQIMGRQNPWLSVYDPSRKPFKETLHLLREQANIASQYADWVSPGEESSAAAIGRGDGALVRLGMKKLAVYRDDDGALHARSAKCPHLGCVVHWNGVEKTWDCPCHGSRFDSYGGVLHGPAISGLAAVDEGDLAELMELPASEERGATDRRPEA